MRYRPRGSSASYGKCPICGQPGVSRERRPNGNDQCANGHVYPSADAVGVVTTEASTVPPEPTAPDWANKVAAHVGRALLAAERLHPKNPNSVLGSCLQSVAQEWLKLHSGQEKTLVLELASLVYAYTDEHQQQGGDASPEEPWDVRPGWYDTANSQPLDIYSTEDVALVQEATEPASHPADVIAVDAVVDLLMGNIKVSTGYRSAGLPHLSVRVGSEDLADKDGDRLRSRVRDALLLLQSRYNEQRQQGSET